MIGCLYCIVRVSYGPCCFRLSLSHYHVFTGKSEQQAFYQELSLLYKFRNVPFITKLHGYCDTKEAVMLIKFYPMGALSDYVLGESPAAKIYPMFKKQLHKLLIILSQTIAYMHSQHIVHCDLKPQNVLLDADANGLLVPILSDLGISSITDDSALLVTAFQVSWQRGLSLSYAAPELFVRFRSRYTETSPQILKAADVYALSIIMLNLITRAKPWSVQQRQQ